MSRWDKEGREMKPVEATHKATGWTTKKRSELFCSDMFHFLRQQLVTEDDSSPRVTVQIRPTIVSQSVSAHKSDNVTQVQRRRSSLRRESVPADEALACRRTERYSPCHKEPYQNVIFITNERDMPHCIRAKSDLMWCMAAFQSQCYLGHPDSPVCSVF